MQVDHKNEIFRHLRPQWFDQAAKVAYPLKNGGLSVLLLPVEEHRYCFWIYICPLDTPFSAKTAVSSLRERVGRGVIPWGSIELNDDPIIVQVVKSIMDEKHRDSDVAKIALEIMMTVWAAESKKQKALQQPSIVEEYSR